MSAAMEEDEQRQTGSEGMGWAASLEATEGGYGCLEMSQHSQCKLHTP